jgi:putative transcriptional regulator
MTPADIIAARERMGLTQARLAALLGVPIGTLRNWEQGRRQAPAFLRLALQALDTPQQS